MLDAGLAPAAFISRKSMERRQRGLRFRPFKWKWPGSRRLLTAARRKTVRSLSIFCKPSARCERDSLLEISFTDLLSPRNFERGERGAIFTLTANPHNRLQMAD